MTTSTDVLALELTGITLAYTRADGSALTIADGLDLQVPAGTVHCLAGRSGSGKTTLLRIATGALPPDAGSVRWAGARIDRLSANEIAQARRSHIGYVDQDATVIDELTSLDNVLLPAIPTGVSRDLEHHAHELLTTFGLDARAALRARILSGGERQRLAIARALLLRPTVIALDEPTANLDRDAADTVIHTILKTAERGTAVLVASHDQAMINASSTVTRLF